MREDVNAKAASPGMMEQWGMVSIRASELAELRAEVARLTAREAALVEALKPFAALAEELRGRDETHIPVSMRVRDLLVARVALVGVLGPPARRG